MREIMVSTDPSSDGPAPFVLDVFRYRSDEGCEHFVAQQTEGEQIVATLRLDAVRAAPIAMLRRLGLSTLPDTDGAYARLAAEPDAPGIAGLTEVLASAYAVRADDPDDGFWLAACPATLVDSVAAIGWRVLTRSLRTDQSDVPMVLLLDELDRFAHIGSPLASAAPHRRVQPLRLASLLEALELPMRAEPPSARRSAG